MMGPKYVTSYDKKKAVEEYKEGASLREVAKAHGVSHQAVRLWILAAGERLHQVGKGSAVNVKRRRGRAKLVQALINACEREHELSPAVREALDDLYAAEGKAKR